MTLAHAHPDAELLELVARCVEVGERDVAADCRADRLRGDVVQRVALPDALKRRDGDPRFRTHVRLLPDRDRSSWYDDNEVKWLRRNAADFADPVERRRVDEIIAAHDQHQANFESVAAALGVDRAEAEAAALSAERRELFEAVLAWRPKTHAGAIAKARIVEQCRNGDWTSDCVHDTSDIRMAITVCRDLVELGPAA